MNRFKSFTEFESFVQEVREEFKDKLAHNQLVESDDLRFLIQLNTELKGQGFEIKASDPVVTGLHDALALREQIRWRIFKGDVNPSNIEK